MNRERILLLRKQFNLTWALAEVHLAVLNDEDVFWAPAALHWTVHQGEDGHWRPDWDLSEDGTEPDPVPVPTVGWVCWHLGWWWSTMLDHLRGRVPRDREDVYWPGTAESTVAWLRRLSGEYLELFDDLDDSLLDGPSSFPWAPETERTVAETLAWANVELMKNISEIGQLRILRAATEAD